MNLPTQKENILFLDIETVPESESFQDLSEAKQELFALKTAYQRKPKQINETEIAPGEFYEKAGIWAEFGRKPDDKLWAATMGPAICLQD